MGAGIGVAGGCAAVDVVGLPQRMDAVDVHRKVQIGADGAHVLTVEFVGLVDALRVPVGPEDGIFEDADGERVPQSAVHHPAPPRPVQTHAFDDVCTLTTIRPY